MNHRYYFEFLREFSGASSDAVIRIKREHRDELRRITDPLIASPLRRPMKQLFKLPWRVRYDREDYESHAEYCIVADAKFTNEEKQELIELLWINIFSPYDCTGKVFTTSIHIADLPCGTLIIHRKAIDV